jgi:ATP-dependent DNA helicase RecG
MITLDSNITDISRVGATTAKRLNKIGIMNVRDLLFYFPYKYDDFRTITPIANVIPFSNANIIGNIEMIQNRRSHRRRMNITEALISDETDSAKIIWFNQPFIAKNLKIGDKVSIAGKVEGDKYEKTFISPIYEKISANTIHTGRLVPDYHLTSNITQKQIRFLINQIIDLADKVTDWLPVEIISRQKLLSLSDAIKKMHFPKDFNDVEIAKKRLAFDEIFLVQLQSQIIKKLSESNVANNISFLEEETKKFVASLPFKLTDSQKKAAWVILQDLNKDKPMARLLEGDVGSGKTVVALMAMFNTVKNNYQAVLMAPTEILARQHFNTISKLLNNFNITIGLITGNGKYISNDKFPMTNVKKNPKSKIKNPKSKINTQFIIQNSQIIIGTHALLQENIKFKNLGLVVVDEQHRFGVEQRKKLLQETNGIMPHLLSMTATPIPRTLALALFGDLDLSIIREMPSGRKPVITRIVPEEKREPAYEFIREQIKTGRQVFVICPLIDISDKSGSKSVKEEFLKLDKSIFPELKIGILHGQMKPKDKEETMRQFIANEIKILVSTSVIEVGVDIPNATIMMIEGSDRFGLAQLHQFRGRVGRGNYQSYCFLFTDNENEKTKERLTSLEKCFDGFALSKMDLKFRGPGEVYGVAQKGFPELKIASLFDYELMKIAHEEAERLIEGNFDLIKYPLIKQELLKFERDVHLE